MGEFILADAALGESQEGAARLGLRGLETAADLVRREMHFLTESEGSEEELLAAATGAITKLGKWQYYEGVARAWRLAWIVHANASRNGDAEIAARHAIEAARLAGDTVMERRFLSSLAFAALYGPTRVPDAITRCEQVLMEAAGDRKAEALTPDAELSRDFETLQKMGERSYISTTAACLAEAKYRQGLYGEAEAFCAISQEVSAPDDVASEALWRCVGGKVLGQAGRAEEGEALVREALTLIMRTDDLNQQGDTLMDLAEVLALGDRQPEAAQVMGEAASLFDKKGNVVAAARARTQLAPA